MKSLIQIMAEAQEGIASRRKFIAETKASQLNAEQSAIKQAGCMRKAAGALGDEAMNYKLMARDMQMGAYMNVIGSYAKWRSQ